jgi:hypothetical protein
MHDRFSHQVSYTMYGTVEKNPKVLNEDDILRVQKITEIRQDPPLRVMKQVESYRRHV